MIKKQIALLLSLLLILLSAPLTYAADDAAGLKYKAEILVYDANNALTTAAACGDTIRVDIVLNSTGVANAPLYAVQGKLAYDSNYLLFKDAKSSNSVETSVGHNFVSFGFLDKTLGGINAVYPYQIASLNFVVLQDATTKLIFNQFDVTNLDASKRNIDYSSLQEIKLGTGIRAEDKPALLRLIDVYKNELNSVIVSANADDVSMHTFWVNQGVYDKFKAAIKSAMDIYESTTAEKDDISKAFQNLYSAADEFRANKSYGAKGNNVPDPKPGGGGGGGSSFQKQKVTVTATADGHGTIAEASRSQSVAVNTSVTIVSVPDKGYEVGTVYVNGEAFEGSEKFTIAKVTNDTVVKVTFRWKNVFADVKADDWFYDYVMFVNENGLMNGTGDTTFEPESAVTRGMFVTVIYRMEKEPEADFANFQDVRSDYYFAKAVGWAAENRIVMGVSDTQFAPDENVSREQMATMIYRYAKFKGIDVNSAKANYVDYGNISNYATEAIDFCTAKKIVGGEGNNTFAPQNNATRAEISAVLKRIMENF